MGSDVLCGTIEGTGALPYILRWWEFLWFIYMIRDHEPFTELEICYIDEQVLLWTIVEVHSAKDIIQLRVFGKFQSGKSWPVTCLGRIRMLLNLYKTWIDSDIPSEMATTAIDIRWFYAPDQRYGGCSMKGPVPHITIASSNASIDSVLTKAEPKNSVQPSRTI